jgi:hypothetical protein
VNTVHSLTSYFSKIHFNIIFSATAMSPKCDLFPSAVTVAGTKLKTKLYIPRNSQLGRCESRRVSEISISYEPGRSCSSSQLGRMLFHGPVAALYGRLTEGVAAFKLSRWKKFYLKGRRYGTAFLDVTSRA